MNLTLLLRNSLTRLPEPVGELLAKVPFACRPGIGPLYSRRSRDVVRYESWDTDERRRFIFSRVRAITEYAVEKVPFYRDLYARRGFVVDRLRSLDDIQRIPVITKAMLREWDLAARSAPRKHRYLANTGGSSGEPLPFYIEPSSMGHEWAHMHVVWSKLSYKPRDLKLVFAGRSSPKEAVSYDAVRHHYAVNVYMDFDRVAASLRSLLRRRQVRYLHGYPSAIYEFARYCQEHAPDITSALRQTLRGAFLSSEYPSPVYREYIESVFGIDSVSWYGHTERAVLAYEKEERFVYWPFQTYGYCEAVPDDSSETHRLVGTSYYNFTSPFIRYDTGDLVTPVRTAGGVLEQFRVDAGREGEYIIDRNMKRIPLTALVFGRHHRLFELARFVQIRQTEAGMAAILATLDDPSAISEDAWQRWFDVSGVAVDFTFEVREQPVRTPAGKVPLLVRSSSEPGAALP